MSEDILSYINYRHVFDIKEDTDTDYRCPSCGGSLRCEKGDIRYRETLESKSLRHDECWEHDWVEYNFSASLICKSCHEIVYCIGVGSLTGLSIYGSEEDLAKLEPEDWVSRDFIPKYFVPPLKLIQIPDACPDAVKEDINNSFALAFCDFSASGNKIRSALEKLTLDLLPGSTATFHKRLEDLNQIDQEASDILMSIKWLGNEASHESSLQQFDLAYAFDALSYALIRIYDDGPKRIRGFSRMINSQKGSIAKT
ncbi:DUF4145 domain-containing protein [Shewanella subflava]|uniref:DUF4145 domain-containing protein n=1 Tax=Shewanella subflava TaxID=2986476 RepID=A0ABT3I8M7_9GAMM|nr:DUF4145 domain-containing protein [Shewanella subflava]MCW3172363.1 DUF4145 domain-containing protein [Shewanella subflava]